MVDIIFVIIYHITTFLPMVLLKDIILNINKLIFLMGPNLCLIKL